jgi:hypothetical protein
MVSRLHSVVQDFTMQRAGRLSGRLTVVLLHLL